MSLKDRYLAEDNVVKNKHDAIMMRFKKQPSMFESKVRLKSLIPISPEDEQRTVLRVLMMVLLEPRRR
jgi:hypothetical protein